MKIRDIVNESTVDLLDSFDIELGDTVIETGVVGFMPDGIIVEADDKAMVLMHLNGVVFESVQDVAEAYSDVSGLLAAGKFNRSFIITAELAEGGTKKFRVKAQSERVAKEKFLQHHSQAKILNVQEEGVSEGEYDETELYSGAYVRDEQEGPNGEVFRMTGDPYERRVRIDDRDGRGWYISPSRLTLVDENDPAIAKWFGDNDEDIMEAKYQGREVSLGKPMAGDVKKSKVYVKGPKGNVVKVNFGDKKMRIKKSNPKRRKSFRARHNCDNPGPRWKARYWSCRAW